MNDIGDCTLSKNYEMIASKRIPLKITESDFKTSPEMITDFLHSNGAEKTIGKSYYQAITPNSRNSKSPKLGPITSRPLSLYGVVNNFDEKKDYSSSAPTAMVMATNSDKDRVETFSILFNALPIRLPDNIGNEFFIERLSNFEKAHSFSAKYVPNRDNSRQNNINKRLYEMYEMDIIQDSQQKRESIHDVITESNETSFAYGRMWDAYCFGKIIEIIYDTSKNDTSLSLLCNKGNKENDEGSNYRVNDYLLYL
jgi:hypothetical protein